MSNQRTHHVTTTDGVTIGATVHGEGPPLVFLHGIIGDADLDWQALLPHLTGRFTCHLPSMRCRGLSGDHPNLGFDRQVDDLIAYVDSIGEPVRLVGWSGGGSMALAVAARLDAVVAVAAVEPGMLSLADEHEKAALRGAITRTAELVAEGRLAAASGAFAGWPFNDDEVATAETAGYFEAAGRYAPNLLSALQQFMQNPPTVDDPAVLAAITAPVLVLVGSDTRAFFASSARHVADHVPNARMQQIADAAHASPLTHPGAVAEALTEFFAPATQPA